MYSAHVLLKPAVSDCAAQAAVFGPGETSAGLRTLQKSRPSNTRQRRPRGRTAVLRIWMMASCCAGAEAFRKIDHFVVLLMENHAADNYFGCMDLPGFDGIRGGHTVPVDPYDLSRGVVNITCGGDAAKYVCSSAPGYDTFAGKFGLQGSPHEYPYSQQVPAAL